MIHGAERTVSNNTFLALPKHVGEIWRIDEINWQGCVRRTTPEKLVSVKRTTKTTTYLDTIL